MMENSWSITADTMSIYDVPSSTSIHCNFKIRIYSQLNCSFNQNQIPLAYHRGISGVLIIFYFFYFRWEIPLIRKRLRSNLQIQDLYNARHSDRSETLADALEM